MKFYRTLAVLGSIIALSAVPALADPDAPDSTAGIYAGTFLCAAGEMGMTLSVTDISQAEIEAQGPCRSGSGPCNERHKVRPISGVINFFPTVGNPSAPAGAFDVLGTAKRLTKKATRIELAPGAWLEQPNGFGASGLKATLYKGNLNGVPTADGCHDMKLTRLTEN